MAVFSSTQALQCSIAATTYPVSPIPVRLSHLRGLPGKYGDQIRLVSDALSIGRSADAAAILIDLSDQLNDLPLHSGRIRMQAAPALIDAGQHARAWSCVQSAIRLLTSGPAVQGGRQTLQTAEWCIISAVSACCGNGEMAGTCSSRAIQSLSPFHDDALECSVGSRTLLLQYGDALAVQATAMLTSRSTFEAALGAWSRAYRMHFAAGDREAAVRDLLGMCCCEKSLGRQQDATESQSMGIEILEQLCTTEVPGYANQLLHQFSCIVPCTVRDQIDERLTEYQN